MSDNERSPIADIVELLHRHGLWALLVFAMVSGAANRLIDLAQRLVEKGVWHFWAMVFVVALLASLYWMHDRMTRIAQLRTVQVALLEEENRRLRNENRQMRDRLDGQQPLPLTAKGDPPA